MYKESLVIANLIKETNPNVKIVMGGNYATTLAENIIRNQKSIDYVVRFAGEKAFADILGGKNPNDIPNLVHRDKNDNVIVNETCNDFNLSMNLVKTPSNFANIRTSHGCNAKPRCSFCSISTNGFKQIKPSEFIEQIKFHFDVWNDIPVSIKVSDDNFLANKKFIRECAELFEKENFPKGKVTMNAFVSPNDLREEDIPYLKAMRVISLFLGFDSGDEKMLKQLGKRNTPEDNVRAAKLAVDNKMTFTGSYIVGHPYETAEQMENTYQNAREISSLKEDGKGINLDCEILRVDAGCKNFETVCEHHPEFKTMDDITSLEVAHKLSQITCGSVDEQYARAMSALVTINKIRALNKQNDTHEIS
jgi:radical SAM superfamily enzyme YgiQ (UPF0313 family)